MTTNDFQSLANEKSYAIRLFQQLNKLNTQQNLVFSPLSLMTLLGILLNVADEKTKQQMLDAWHFSGTDAIDKINQLLTSPYITYNWKTDQLEITPPAYKIANALFLHPQYQLASNFQQLLDKYQTQYYPLDNEAVTKANQWVNEITDGQIESIINQLDPNTVLLLINAICFHGKWPDHYFNKQHTKSAPFYGDKQTTVAMMQQNNLSNYYEDENLQAITVKYTDEEYSLFILLPKSKQPTALDTLIENLSYNYLDKIHSQTYTPMDNIKYQGSLYLPRFTINYENDQLIKYSQQLFGVDLNYNLHTLQGASFNSAITNLNKDDPLIIGQFIHKATITVNEEGTDAAAVTAVAMALGCIPTPPKIISFEMRVDRPFIFGLQDRQKRLLFLGTVREIENV